MSLEIFISYAHKDRRLRDELAAHLATLRNQHIISDWFDGDLIPGTPWQPHILHHLRTARIILLLVSAHFINSPFCWDIELQETLARQQSGQARIIPILLRPCDWQNTPSPHSRRFPPTANPSAAGPPTTTPSPTP